MGLADDTAIEDFRQLQNGFDFVANHAADGDAGPVRHDRGDRLLVDMGIDHPLLGRDALQRVELVAQLGAFCGRLVVLLRCRQYLPDAPDVVDEGLLGGPFGFQTGKLLLESRNIRIEAGHAVGVVGSEIGVADQRGFLRLARDDGGARVLDQGQVSCSG